VYSGCVLWGYVQWEYIVGTGVYSGFVQLVWTVGINNSRSGYEQVVSLTRLTQTHWTPTGLPLTYLRFTPTVHTVHTHCCTYIPTAAHAHPLCTWTCLLLFTLCTCSLNMCTTSFNTPLHFPA